MTVSLTVKLGGKSHTIQTDSTATVSVLHEAIRAHFDVAVDSLLRVLLKGKALAADPEASLQSIPGIEDGAKLMVMVSKAAEAAAVDSAPRERMRGFEEDDLRSRTGSVGKASTGAATVFKTRSTGPTYRFHGLKPLAVLPEGVTPDVPAAAQRLKELSEDPAILAIMKKHQYQVGCLSEMPPEGQVGVSPECLMGLNKNAGQEILLRLRTDDGLGMRPYQSVIPVLLHELTHNVWSDHDDRFKRLCSQLPREYKELQEPGYPTTRSDAGGASSSQSAGHVLGGGGTMSIVEARAKAMGFYSPAPAAAAAGAEAAQAMETDAQAGRGDGDEQGGFGCACGKCGAMEQCSPCEVTNPER